MNENEYKVLDLILNNSNITIKELSNKIGISTVAISKIIKKLTKESYLIEDKTMKPKGKGRPQKLMTIRNNSNKIIGVNLGAGFIDISLGDLKGNIITSKRKKFFMKQRNSIVELLFNELDYFFNKYNRDEIVGIGLALNGIVDSDNRIVIFSPYFKWKNFNIGAIVENRYNIPVMIDNDVRAMLDAEIRFGLAKDLDNLFYLYMKNGIGGSILLNKRIYLGSNLCSGEIGHYIINKDSNLMCKCGKRGCMETEFSETSVRLMIQTEYERLGQEDYLKDKEMFEIYREASLGNKIVRNIISNISYKIGEVVGNVMNVLDIKDIIIAGDIIYSAEVFKENFEKGIKNSLNENFCPKIKIHLTSLTNEVEKKGALSLVMKNLFANLKLIK